MQRDDVIRHRNFLRLIRQKRLHRLHVERQRRAEQVALHLRMAALAERFEDAAGERRAAKAILRARPRALHRHFGVIRLRGDERAADRVGQYGVMGHRVEQLAGDRGHAAEDLPLRAHGDEFIVRARQNEHGARFRLKEFEQADGLRLLAAHHIHHAEIIQIDRPGEVAHAGDEVNRERRDLREALRAHRVAQVGGRGGRGHVRNFEQPHVAGNHAIGDAALHIARVQPVPGEKLLDALGERRLQAPVVPVHRSVANAAVPRDGIQRLALVAEQRHAQVGRSPVND